MKTVHLNPSQSVKQMCQLLSSCCDAAEKTNDSDSDNFIYPERAVQSGSNNRQMYARDSQYTGTHRHVNK